jgi:hypothetical protein
MLPHKKVDGTVPRTLKHRCRAGRWRASSYADRGNFGLFKSSENELIAENPFIGRILHAFRFEMYKKNRVFKPTKVEDPLNLSFNNLCNIFAFFKT